MNAILIVAVTALVTIAVRFLPFAVFGRRPLPRMVTYLGRVLPPAIMAALVVYCLKATPVMEAPHGIPELIAVAVTAGLHVWKRNNLLSIGTGTVLYMVLIQAVF